MRSNTKKMKSLKELYRIGKGPSSSHTIGPERACKLFASENPEADSFKAILYGSLAKTGIGHGTDRVIKSVLKNVDVICDTDAEVPHPNTMDLYAYREGVAAAVFRVYSVGGRAIRIEGRVGEEGRGGISAAKFFGNQKLLRGKFSSPFRLCVRMRRGGNTRVSL